MRQLSDLRPARVYARSLMFAGGILLAAPFSLHAQPGGVGPACEIDANSPKELLVASLAYQRATAAEVAEDRQKALQQVLKELSTKPDRFKKNIAGQQYVLAQSLSLWLTEPGISIETARGPLGYTTEPDATINLVDAIDEAFDAIVAAAPHCASDVAAMRQNEAWLAMTRRAMETAQTIPDSATLYANYSLQLSPGNPYPYHVLAMVAQAKNDAEGAVTNWNATVKAAGNDTTYSDLRRSSLYYLGMYQLEQARDLEGEARKSKLDASAEAFRTFLAEAPTSSDAPNIMQGLAEVYTLAGDSARVPSVYAPMLASPSQFGDVALSMGGVLATRAERIDDAVALFEAAIEANPHQRDALRNLAASYYAQEAFFRMFKPLEALVKLDPNNPDAWLMYAYASQGLQRAATADADKRNWADSAMKYVALSEGLPVKAEVTGFDRSGDGAALTVSLEGNAETPKGFALDVEFLNLAGTVVGTGSVAVEPIPMGETRSVKVEGSGAGIIGYRYKRIE